MHISSGYAMEYGRPVVVGLPGKCEDGGGAECPDGWFTKDAEYERGTSSTLGTLGTVYFSERAWQRYDKYYSFIGSLSVEPGDERDTTGVTLHARAVGSRAYVTLGYSSSALAPLGLPPVPSLTAAAPLALLIPVWLGWNAGTRKRAGAAGVTTTTASWPGAAAGSGAGAAGAGASGGAQRARPARPPQDATTSRTSSPRRTSGPVTVTARQARVTADRAGSTVEQSRGPVGMPHWHAHLRMDWPDLERLEFWNDARDPIVALFAYPAAGSRRYALDASHLTRAQWSELAAAVAAMTGQRIRLDLGGLDARWVNPDA